MRNTDVPQEQIVRILGLPACATLEYYWEDMNFLPDEIIPHRLLEGDFAMQEALLRLANRTDLAQNMKKGWRLSIAVYEAGMALSLAGDLRICQAVDPNKTCRMEVPLGLLTALGYCFP